MPVLALESSETAVEVAIEPMELLVSLLPAGAQVLTDRWDLTGPFVQALSRMQLGALMRLKRTRTLSRPAPPRLPGKRGPPRKDGDWFEGSRQESWGEPDETWKGTDGKGHPISVQSWSHWHLRQAQEVEVVVFRVLRERAKGTKRDPRESWLVWVGQKPLPLAEVGATSRRRFSHEHTSRFVKQDWLWTKVRVRTPEQFERWSVVVATALNQLVLARSLGQVLSCPWERRREVVTPRQVRRVMPAILQQVGTPARAPKPRGKSPGRAKGFCPKEAVRSPVVRKRPQVAENTS